MKVTGTRGTGWAAAGGPAIKLREARKVANGPMRAKTWLRFAGGVEAVLRGLRVIGGGVGGESHSCHQEAPSWSESGSC